MGRRYSIEVQDTNTSSITMLELRSTAAIRPRIYDFMLGSPATPADQAATYTLNRTTTAATSATAITPQALDPGDPAATATAVGNHQNEPVYTAGAVLLKIALNQRASFRWVAAPGGELVLPASAAGVGLRAVQVTSAFATDSVLHFEE